MKYLYFLVLLVLLSSCLKKEDTLFRKLPSSHTGITFANTINESDSVNAFTNQYLYNGGGVAIADFNNDNLPDIFFTGNMVSCALYLNSGELKFKDISSEAGIHTKTWINGVTIVDINQDGFKDIYLSAGNFFHPLQSKSFLYVNQGIKNGIPQFKEMSDEYGLIVNAYAVQAGFFDYDRDGDLDMYQLVNGYIESRSNNNSRPKDVNGQSITVDRLYRNEGINDKGHPYFKEVSREANLLIEGYGLGLAISDINDDGWPDVYAANDFLTNDLLWINNRDGTFTNKAAQYLRHQSFNSMGIDIADYNNDGLPDIFVVDMEPEDNYRKKMMSTGPNYKKQVLALEQGYELQYVRNVLQLNNGKLPNGDVSFSDVGQLAGVHQTDWSWSPLLADFDNDGLRDLFISNGFRKDITDLDFVVYNYDQGMFGDKEKKLSDFKLKYKEVPEIKLANYFYKNKGDLTFDDVSSKWGFDDVSYSSGAAFGDLDNDGDLDLVVNNIDAEVFVYENQQQQKSPQQYLKVKLEGPVGNRDGLGVKIKLFAKRGIQVHEHQATRGYISSMEETIHFGLGELKTIDSLQVIWTDGKVNIQKNVSVNQTLVLHYTDAHSDFIKDNIAHGLFENVTKVRSIAYKHQEYDYVDFDINRLNPHKHSQYGPSVSVGDVNSDGLDDFFVGGGKDFSGSFFFQQVNGKFIEREFKEHIRHEDLGSLLFDFDQDGDLDLYVVSGSVEYYKGVKEFQDRLYVNDGKGNFTARLDLLPEIRANGSCIKAADFDSDGDLDLFVGGHVVPGQYPLPDRSYLLENENGKFIDVTQDLAPGLDSIGLVMDALWTDIDNDGAVDLIVVGEWMPFTVFRNVKGKFLNVTEDTGIAAYTGWWNSIASGDFDHDGDIDYIGGNLGLNSSYKISAAEPMKLLVKDFDNNGAIDPILTYYLKGVSGKREPQVSYARDHLISQLPYIKAQFKTYGEYAKATVNDIFPEDRLKDAHILQATCFQNSYIENLGNGRLRLNYLPIEAQVAPLFGMHVEDVTGDGNLDIVGVGNFYGADVKVGRYDASVGIVLEGNGKGNFKALNQHTTGFFVASDAKAISTIIDKDNNELFVVSANQDSLKVFQSKKKMLLRYPLLNNDFKAEINYDDGTKEIRELYYGSSYLSQSTRVLTVAKPIKQIIITTYKGETRIIKSTVK